MGQTFQREDNQIDTKCVSCEKIISNKSRLYFCKNCIPKDIINKRIISHYKKEIYKREIQKRI